MSKIQARPVRPYLVVVRIPFVEVPTFMSGVILWMNEHQVGEDHWSANSPDNIRASESRNSSEPWVSRFTFEFRDPRVAMLFKLSWA